MSEECQGKRSWPELVGIDGQTAKRIIEQENPLVEADIIGPDSSYLPVVLCNRVLVWVDAGGKVIAVPHIG